MSALGSIIRRYDRYLDYIFFQGYKVGQGTGPEVERRKERKCEERHRSYNDEGGWINYFTFLDKREHPSKRGK